MNVQDWCYEGLHVQQHSNDVEKQWWYGNTAPTEVIVGNESVRQSPGANKDDRNNYQCHCLLVLLNQTAFIPVTFQCYHDNGTRNKSNEPKNREPANHKVEEVPVCYDPSSRSNIDSCHSCCEEPNCCYGNMGGTPLTHGLKARQLKTQPKCLQQ